MFLIRQHSSPPDATNAVLDGAWPMRTRIGAPCWSSSPKTPFVFRAGLGMEIAVSLTSHRLLRTTSLDNDMSVHRCITNRVT